MEEQEAAVEVKVEIDIAEEPTHLWYLTELPSQESAAIEASTASAADNNTGQSARILAQVFTSHTDGYVCLNLKQETADGHAGLFTPNNVLNVKQEIVDTDLIHAIKFSAGLSSVDLQPAVPLCKHEVETDRFEMHQKQAQQNSKRFSSLSCHTDAALSGSGDSEGTADTEPEKVQTEVARCTSAAALSVAEVATKAGGTCEDTKVLAQEFTSPRRLRARRAESKVEADTVATVPRARKGRKKVYTSEKPHVCAQCNACFRWPRGLRLHMLIHTGEKPHICSHCGAVFRQKRGLMNHEAVHTGIRPYLCTQCGASYIHNKDLKLHILKHTGEKPHKCTLCDASYYVRYHLKAHMLTHSGERPHKCSQCNATFTLKTNLRLHKFTHTGEKPNKCTQCDASFLRLSHLKDHMLSHTGERQHMCGECGVWFIRKQHLKQHMVIHTGRHRCTQCNKSYNRKRQLKHHMLTRHTDEKNNEVPPVSPTTW